MSSRRIRAIAAIAAATFVPLAAEAAKPAPPPEYHYTDLVPVYAGQANGVQDTSRDGVVVGYTQTAPDFQLEGGGTCWPQAAAVWDMSVQPSQSSRPPDFVDDLGGCTTCASGISGISPDGSFAVGWAGTPDDGLTACSTGVRRAAVWERTGTTWVRTFLEPLGTGVSEARAVAVVGGVPIATGRVAGARAVVWRKLGGVWTDHQELPDLDPATNKFAEWGLSINEMGWVSGSLHYPPPPGGWPPSYGAAIWICDASTCAGPYAMPATGGGGTVVLQGKDVTENGDVLGNSYSPEQPLVWRFAGMSGGIPTWSAAEPLPQLQSGSRASGYGIAEVDGVLTVVGSATTTNRGGSSQLYGVRWQRLGGTWSAAAPIENLDDASRKVTHAWRVADTGRIACHIAVSLSGNTGGLERPIP